MRTLLYVIPAEFMDDSDGVTKKAKQQVRAFSNNGYRVDVVSYNKLDIVHYAYRDKRFLVLGKKSSTRFKRRNDLFDYAQKFLAPQRYDVCYMRYPFASFRFIEMARCFKKNGTHNIVEVPTYPIPHPLKKGLKSLPNRLIFAEEMFCVGNLKKYVDQIYSMGEPVDEIFGINNKNIPNGIDIKQFRPKNINKRSDIIRVFYCGSLFIYQGLDRLINGIAEYNATKSENDPQIIAEIVGDGPEMATWSALVKEKHLEEYVTFHGFLSGEALDAVVDRCDVACSLLAVHRGYSNNASPLKTKEYMARGIPFVYAYNENGMDSKVDFALKINTEDTPIDMRVIVDFYNTYADKQEAIIEKMRSYAFENYSWESILKGI